MKAKEVRGREPDDLRKELRQLRRTLFDLKFQWQAEEKPDTSQRQRLRRDIARILTVLREMEAASSTGGHSG
jgi:large subunit ribosomal protein L29